MPSCVGDAMPSVAGYHEQEFLVARCFAFLHVLTIFFGLFVDAASRDGSAAEVCVDSCAAPTRLTCMCVCGKKKQLKKRVPTLAPAPAHSGSRQTDSVNRDRSRDRLQQ